MISRVLVGVFLTLFAAVGAMANDVGDLLSPYIGQWQAEESRKTPDGRQFHFAYELSWFDATDSIARMTIEQVFDDGERRLLWQGFKGADVPNGTVFYYGFSPLGRVGQGTVDRVGDEVVTLYQGFSMNGAPPVQIRDRFMPVVSRRFLSITEMRPDETAEWKEIGRDTWQKGDRKKGMEAIRQPFRPPSASSAATMP